MDKDTHTHTVFLEGLLTGALGAHPGCTGRHYTILPRVPSLLPTQGGLSKASPSAKGGGENRKLEPSQSLFRDPSGNQTNKPVVPTWKGQGAVACATCCVPRLASLPGNLGSLAWDLLASGGEFHWPRRRDCCLGKHPQALKREERPSPGWAREGGGNSISGHPHSHPRRTPHGRTY